jgi:glycosyltransferase involved in cell wall biosynthesis
MSPRLSILLTNRKRGWSGETAYIYELATRLPEAAADGEEIDVTLVTRAGSVLGERLRERGVDVRELEFDPRWERPDRWVGDVRAIRRVAAERSVDVLHTNASWDTWMGTIALCNRSGVARIRTKHNLKRIRTHLANRWFYGHLIQWVIAPSATVLEHLRDSPVVPGDSIRSISYGIPLEPFLAAGRQRPQARAALAGELGMDPGDLGFTACYISRITPRKNPGALVEAMRRLGPDSGVRAVFVGNGLLDELRAQAAGLDNVHVLGFRSDPAPYHAAADAFVLPSYNEAFGMAAVEAMAAGTPAILADRGGFREMVEDGVSGLFFDADDADVGIARCLQRLRDEGDLGARIGAAGRERTVRLFSAERMVASTLEFYRSVVARDGSG